VSPPLFFACCWAIAATATAMLPMRYQIVPGFTVADITINKVIAQEGIDCGSVSVRDGHPQFL
jgi:hypothetical protein